MKQKINILVLSLLISSLGTIFHVDAGDDIPQTQPPVASANTTNASTSEDKQLITSLTLDLVKHTLISGLIRGIGEGIGKGIATPVNDILDAFLDKYCSFLHTKELQEKKRLAREINTLNRDIAFYNTEAAKAKHQTPEEVEHDKKLTKRHSIASTELVEIDLKIKQAQLQKSDLDKKQVELNNQSVKLQIDNAHLNNSSNNSANAIKNFNSLNENLPTIYTAIDKLVIDPTEKEKQKKDWDRQRKHVLQQMHEFRIIDNRENTVYLLKQKKRLDKDAKKLGVELDNQGFLIEKPE